MGLSASKLLSLSNFTKELGVSPHHCASAVEVFLSASVWLGVVSFLRGN
jgi:hypothetical protein